MTALILTEKYSASEKFIKAFGGTTGSFEGTDFRITHASGHLYELASPDQQVDASLRSQYKTWSLNNLPWDPAQMKFDHVEIYNASSKLKKIAADAKGCTEVIMACDVDPSGEGGMIAANIVRLLGLESKKLTRMYFVDESPTALQKAFRQRKEIPDLDSFDEYQKALFRSKWDFLSMQFTRIATVSAAQRAVLRQGRLKSAMVSLVGDQLKAYHDYVEKPFFQNRFSDENEVMYTNPEEPRYATAEEVPASYSVSDVVLDSRQNKFTKPPKLLDLSALSSRLSSKGVKAKEVLSVYQQMYEAQVVSYPRTEDSTITGEQFKEMLPHVDAIASVAGVDPSELTHRKPRSSHVKDSGAHGANRPGPNVPESLNAVEAKYGRTGRLIYEELARSFLAMLAEDYVYEAQVGHVKDYPKFIGRAQVPKKMGWRVVFDTQQEPDEEENEKGLGSRAEPYAYRGKNKRPPHPSMTWLMNQLERRNVGTGATRTSTYSEVTKEPTKNDPYPLLKEAKGRITMTEFGEMSYRILPGTKIGDLSITERVFSQMDQVASGDVNPDQLLAEVADLVAHDIEVMETNAQKMRDDMGKKIETVVKEKMTGTTVEGKEVEFSREFDGYRFSDEEVEKLLAGETIVIWPTSKKGNKYGAKGKFGEGTMNGTKYYGFQLLGFVDDVDDNGVPKKMAGATFTDDERKRLAAGERIERDGFWSPKKKKSFSAGVVFDAASGKLSFDFNGDTDDNGVPKKMAGVTFTDEERKRLAAGERIERGGFWSSKKKKEFSAPVVFDKASGQLKFDFNNSTKTKAEGKR